MLQRLDALERLARAQHIFLDKTGTLTEDRLHLRAVVPTAAALAAGADALGLQATAAWLAAWSQHPLSRALADSATGEATVGIGEAALAVAPVGNGFSMGAWHGVQERPGLGLSAHDDQGTEWRLGSLAWVQAVARAPAAQDPGDSNAARVAFGPRGAVWATFDFDETLRPGTLQAVHELQAAGAEVTLLTGDVSARAQALARRLGLQQVVAAARPEDKLAAVAAAQAQGHCVLMVGDGINDAPVLARADVSLAMGQGALVSRGQADAVVTSNNLRDVVRARATAQKALAIVRQNMAWAATYNAVCIPLALVGWLPPWAAGLGMACSSMVVVLNALRAAR
jgi:Cu2+-exporting ATPase